MRTINLKNYPNVCDKIQYETNNGKISQLEFFLHNKNVLQKVREKLVGVSIENLLKNVEKIADKAPFLQDLVNDIKHVQTRKNVKAAIHKKNQNKD